MRGATITHTMNDRGALDPPSFVEAGGRPTWRSSLTPVFARRMAQNQIVLPEQPIGVGARWEIGRESVDPGDVRVADTFTCKLVARRGERLDVEVQIARRPVPPVPEGYRAVSGHGEGKAVLTIDLARFFPVSGTFRSVLDLEEELESGERTASHRASTWTIGDVGPP